MMERTRTIKIAQTELTLRRSKLREWLTLDEIKSAEIKVAVEKRDLAKVANYICEYLSTATSQAQDFWAELPWLETAKVFLAVETLNAPAKMIPFLEVRRKIAEDHQIYWDYPGRSWFIWLHLFASKYGWGIEYIAELDIDEAIPLMQEILTDEQLQKEWEWSTSEVAYPYNPTTKKQEFKSLPRPEWMLPTSESLRIPVIKYKPGLMPVGNVMDLNEGHFDKLVRKRKLDD